MKEPGIPLSPHELPAQRLSVVTELLPRPDPFDAVVGYGKKPKGPRLRDGPRNASHLGQLEWSWSPMNGRIYDFYIHRSRRHWILWLRYLDDNEDPWRWPWMPIGYVPLEQASQLEAAVYLLIDFLMLERDDGVDRFHWIGSTGLFDVAQWKAIGRSAWDE